MATSTTTDQQQQKQPTHIPIIREEGETPKGWVLVELQGELCLMTPSNNTSPSIALLDNDDGVADDRLSSRRPTLASKTLGTLKVDEGNATLIIGSHKLEGKRTTLAKP